MSISEEVLRNIYENLMDAFACVDMSGRIRMCNDLFCAMLGYTREELFSMTYSDVTPGKWHAFESGIISSQVLVRGFSDIYEKEYRRKDGTDFPVELRACLLRDESGAPDGMWAIVRDISERKRMQEALRASEERYRAVVEDQTEVIARFLADGALTFVNDVYCRFFGKPRGELLGTKWQPHAFPADVAAIEEKLGGLSPDNPVAVIENRAYSGNGHLHWMQFVNRGFFDSEGRLTEIQSVGRDITERRRAEQHLALMNFALDMVHEEACLIDEDGSFRYVNEESCRALGYPREELLGLKVADIEICRTREEWIAHWWELVKSGVLTYETRHRRRDGREYPVEVNACYFEYEGRGYGLYLSRDITERRRVEEERLALEGRLQHARRMESLGVLAKGIAHDFNNLLTAVLGNLDLALARLPLDSPARERIMKSAEAGRRAAQLVGQILAYAGKGMFIPEVTDLNRLIRENEELFRTAAASAVLKIQASACLPAVRADGEQLLQVIMNLVTNASEALVTSPGVITLGTGVMECDAGLLSRSRIDEIPAPGPFVYLEVSDTGCGMDAETQGRIFEPFFTTKFIGRGLGMSAVMGIVRRHHGAILLDSEPGRGSTFRVLLPVSPPSPHPAEEVPA